MDTDTRNVIDYYKYWNTEAILADLDEKRNNFSILCSNIYQDFNLSTAIRNSNAFLAKEVIIYGRKRYDKRGAVGTFNYTHFKYVRELEDLNNFIKEEKDKGSLFVGIDNINNSLPIESHIWPKDRHIIFCFGQEQVGLPQEIIDECDEIRYISQYGSVRSLNVGVASGIVMYSYVSQL